MQAGGLSSAIPNEIKDYLNSENMPLGKKRRRNEQKFHSFLNNSVSGFESQFHCCQTEAFCLFVRYRIIICPVVNLFTSDARYYRLPSLVQCLHINGNSRASSRVHLSEGIFMKMRSWHLNVTEETFQKMLSRALPCHFNENFFGIIFLLLRRTLIWIFYEANIIFSDFSKDFQLFCEIHRKTLECLLHSHSRSPSIEICCNFWAHFCLNKALTCFLLIISFPLPWIFEETTNDWHSLQYFQHFLMKRRAKITNSRQKGKAILWNIRRNLWNPER